MKLWSGDPRAAFRAAAAVGGVLLALAVVLLVVMPRSAGVLPPGFRTPILAFELARSPAEIEAMFAAPGSTERASLVRAMNVGNAIDFAFMAAYGGFLVLFGVAIARAGDRLGRLVAALGLLAPLFDALENADLFAITAALGGDYLVALHRLSVATTCKWTSIALAVAATARFVSRGGGAKNALAIVVVAPLALAPFAFARRGALAEAMGASVTTAFLALFAVAIAAARTKGPPDEPWIVRHRR